MSSGERKGRALPREGGTPRSHHVRSFQMEPPVTWRFPCAVQGHLETMYSPPRRCSPPNSILPQSSPHSGQMGLIPFAYGSPVPRVRPRGISFPPVRRTRFRPSRGLVGGGMRLLRGFPQSEKGEKLPEPGGFGLRGKLLAWGSPGGIECEEDREGGAMPAHEIRMAVSKSISNMVSVRFEDEDFVLGDPIKIPTAPDFPNLRILRGRLLARGIPELL